ELFDEGGRLRPELAELAPAAERTMSENNNANGGSLLRELHMPDFRDYEVSIPYRGIANVGNVKALGPFIRDIIKLNEDHHNFRLFGPDETVSNRLEDVFDVTNRQWSGRTVE